MAYKVMIKGLSSWTSIPAASYEQDGSGTRFKDSDGALVASFADGQLSAVLPADVEVTDETDTAEETSDATDTSAAS